MQRVPPRGLIPLDDRLRRTGLQNSWVTRPGPSVLCTLVFACGAIAANTLAQPQEWLDPFVRSGVTQQVSDHAFVIPDGNVAWVPNVGIVVGSRATLIIDPGLGRVNGETVAAEVAKVSQTTEHYIASTHFHPEHTTGYLAFPDATYVNSTMQDDEYAESTPALMELYAGSSPIIGELLREVTQRRADISFDREYMLDLGGVQVQMWVLGPMHTKADTTFFVEPDGVLFAGDAVMKNSFPNASEVTSMRAWLAAFDRLEVLRPVTIVPAHGRIGDGSLIGTYRTLMETIQVRTEVLKAQAMSMDEVAAVVQDEMQARHPDWVGIHGVAAASRAAFREAPQ